MPHALPQEKEYHMKKVSTRRVGVALVVIPVSLAIALSGCASGSVGGGSTPKASASSGSAGPYASIIPKGNIVAFSKKLVADDLAASTGFTPKSTGPKAQDPGATIAYVAADGTNGGITTVESGVQEAATEIGWKVDVFDGLATAAGNTNAIDQAIAAKPVAIILGGVDPTQEASAIATATSAGIPVVGWHAGTTAGPGNGLFTNVTTNPLAVSQIAAAYAVANSNGKAKVVIFTDSEYAIAVEKAKAMEAYVKACSGCTVLNYEDSPIATASTRMPGIVSQLLQAHKSNFYMLAINGAYFDGSEPALRSASQKPSGPPYEIAAGDGSASELQRIRTAQYQTATVADPLILEGWDAVDEVNRALAKASWSGFVPAPGLITKANVPSGTTFDPTSGYKSVYEKVWGK
jgi:ribose transport system substrate-binding protein